MEILRYVVLANGLLTVVSLVHYVLLRRETFFGANRLALWLGLAGALLIPLLELPDWRPQPVRTVMQRTAQVIVPRVLLKRSLQPEGTITFLNGQALPTFPRQHVAIDWSWQKSLIVLYIIGIVVLLIRFIIQLLSVRRLIRQSVHTTYDKFTLVQTERVTSPFSFFDWVVLNPNQHTPDELDQILRHERVHVQERHSLDMIGAELICIVFWFNPAVYLFRLLIHETLEFSADRAVLAEGVDAKKYQYNLLKVGLLAPQSAFANQFSGPTLRQRIGMMNGQRSGRLAWWRYVLWVSLVSGMVFACRHKQENNDYIPNSSPNFNALPTTNLARESVASLEEKGTWYRHLALFEGRFGTESSQSEPIVLHIKGDQFLLPDDYKYSSAVYIDGNEVPIEDLEKLSPEFVSELFVMHQWENLANIDTKAKPYQIFVQTSPKPILFNQKRRQFFTLLQAATISQHPLGESYSFTMNQLLEATFFHNRNALVERTKNEHLSLYDDYAKVTEVFINNLPAKPADVKTIHVREVARLYTKERPYNQWFRANNPTPRFELHIQTAPKRAKRDSSYYVFSPFYSGDF